jgi:hypothetical protein
VRFLVGLLVAAAVVAAGGAAWALDKQAASHAGGVDQSLDQSVSGSLFLGVMPVNPTYAARPDNSGLALLRAGGHADVNVIGARLFAPIDLNMFTDRCAPNPVRPSELDAIFGIATSWPLAGGQLELGTRIEQDRGIDGTAALKSCNVGTVVGNVQTYADIRLRYAFALGDWLPGLRPALGDGDVSGWLTFGWFALNPVHGSGENAIASYYARPENSGAAFLRYVAHLGVSFWKKRLALVVDTNFFTDKLAPSKISPSELDLTVEAVATAGRFNFHLGYERDMPLDMGGFNSGFVQQMMMVTAGWSFDFTVWTHEKKP